MAFAISARSVRVPAAATKVRKPLTAPPQPLRVVFCRAFCSVPSEDYKDDTTSALMESHLSEALNSSDEEIPGPCVRKLRCIPDTTVHSGFELDTSVCKDLIEQHVSDALSSSDEELPGPAFIANA